MSASLRAVLPLLVLAGAALGCRGDEQAADTAATPAATATAGVGEAGAPAPSPGETAAAGGVDFDANALPAVVARVEGRDITRQQVLDRANAMRAQMAQMGAPAPPQSEEFYREMVDQIIGAELLYMEAKRRQLLPADEEVSAQVARLRQRFPSEEAFRQQLAAGGVDEAAMREDLRRSLAVQKLVDQLAGDVVSEEAARKFYRENAERMQRPAQLRVRHLLVATPRDATAEQREAARQEAAALQARITAGEDFAAIAQASSDDPASRPQGGLLPWFSAGEMVPAFESAASALEKGQTSGVVETPFGYHVLRLEDRRPAAAVPFEEARPQIDEVLRRRQVRDALRDAVAGLRAKAKVEVLF